uniref:START domain-containing protein n=1 Tax=Globisporangium ultimum (strain ATCC 200006 / CBS 805.95 / DAOM BR144) TaxID=431595 RepID=K3X388_GLOUD
MATAQSVLSGYLNRDYISPLNDCIRLGTDWDERRKTLLAMKEQKITNAYEYIAARSKFLDPLKPHVSDEQFENAQGDYCCVRFDTIQFESVKSVKQVFDAFVSYLKSMEVSITERLGNLTVRDDYDVVHDNMISNFRLLSTENGVEIETNGVMFGKYFESHELSNGNPCGVITVDFVDEDKLHPYLPQERMRKDSSTAIVLTPHWRKRPRAEGEKVENGDTDEEELVVTVSRGGFLQLRKPAFPISPRVLQEMRENADEWRNLMIKSIHELLSAHF